MEFVFLLLRHVAMCFLSMAVVSSTSPFLPNTPGREWKRVGLLDMTDPKQQCPNSWQKFTSPRPSCGKKTSAPCDSLNITTSGASYRTVCGRFRGYQIGTPDAFNHAFSSIVRSIETYYVDGVSVTYGSPGNRTHVYTYAAGVREVYDLSDCPCTGGGVPPPLFVGSDYYCESGNPGPGWIYSEMYYSDVLWDRQQCDGDEVTCCNPPNLPWFCKTFPTPISEDLEVRICTDEGLHNENVAIESFELYIQEAIHSINTQVVSVLNPDKTLHHLEISWIPMGSNVTTYIVKVVGPDTYAAQGCIVCTTSPCLYVHQVTHMANSYSIFVTPVNADGTVDSGNPTIIYGPTNFVFQNASFFNYTNSIGCSFLNNQSFYCVVCCSTDPSVPPDSSLYNVSTKKGIEVTVSLQGLTSDQMYYCKAAATDTSTADCVGPVVGGVKVYFSFLANTRSNTSLVSIDASFTIIIITSVTSFVVFFCLGVLVTTCVGQITLHHRALESSTLEMIGNDQNRVAAIEVEANSSYEIARHWTAARQSDYI